MKKTIIFFVATFFAFLICSVLGISALLGKGLVFALKSHVIAGLFIYPFCSSLYSIFIFIPAIVCIIAAKFKKVVLRNVFYILFLFIFFMFGSLGFFFLGTPWSEQAIKKETPNISEIDFDFQVSAKKDLSFVESDTIHVLHFWSLEKDFSDFEKLVLAKGQIVVKALKQFYAKNGFYPETLEDLIPDFLSKIPNIEFYYGYQIFNISFKYQQTESGKNFELGFDERNFEPFHWKEEQNCWVTQ